MSDINILTSVDVEGILKKYKNKIIDHYGWDPTVESPDKSTQEKLLNIGDNMYRLGYYSSESDIIPKYVRLVTSHDSEIGYEITEKDVQTDPKSGKRYLTSIYNLMVQAKNGDNIIWWGHTIKPGQPTQALVYDIVKPGARQEVVPEFEPLERGNATFYYASALIEQNKVERATQTAYRLQGTVNGIIGKDVKYDIVIWLLSGAFMHKGNLITVPIVKLVVDPTVRIIA